MAKFTVDGRTVYMDVLPCGRCCCSCGGMILKKNMHRHLSSCAKFLESEKPEQPFVFGIGGYKEFTAFSPPVPEMNLIFEVNVELALIEGLINKSLSKITKFTEEKEERLEKNKAQINMMERKLEDQKRALEQLRQATEKAEDLLRQTNSASKRLQDLADDAHGLSEEVKTVSQDPKMADPATLVERND